MKGRVKQGKGGALAGGVEGAMHRRAIAAGAAPLHVGGRKRSQRARHFLETEVRQVPRFERGKPVGEDSWR